jgi:hypothetical protein
MGKPEQIRFIVASVFKGITLNKKMRLDPESLWCPETRILRYDGYIYKYLQIAIHKCLNKR